MSRELHGTRLRSIEMAKAVVTGQQSRAYDIARKVLEAQTRNLERRANELQQAPRKGPRQR